MSLLVIACALFISHFLGLAKLRGTAWLHRWLAFMRRYVSDEGLFGGTAGMIVLLGLPLVGVGLLQVFVDARSGPVGNFVFALIAVLCVWGPRDLDRQVDAYLTAPDDAERRERAQDIVGFEPAESKSQQADQVAAGLFRQALQRWFGLLFWFLILGAVGAVLYRITQIVATQKPCADLLSSEKLAASRRLHLILDLIPAHLMVLSLAVLRDFDAIRMTYQKYAESVPHLPGPVALYTGFVEGVGMRAVECRLKAEQAFSNDFEGPLQHVSVAMNQNWRILALWLSVLAVLIIAGLAS